MTDLNTAAVDPATLGATAPAPAEQPAADNTLTFQIPNTETQIGVELGNIPANIRLDMLKKAVRDYIVNSVNQANVRATKANAAHDAYDEAMKADALQTAVTKPTDERTDPKLLDVAADARKRLYEGTVRKQGDGTGTARKTVDPLVKMVTDAVVRELYEKKRAADPKYTFLNAKAEVGTDGVAYLDGRIAEAVAGGADGKALEAFKQARYINPAQMMLGIKTNKATADQSLLG